MIDKFEKKEYTHTWDENTHARALKLENQHMTIRGALYGAERLFAVQDPERLEQYELRNSFDVELLKTSLRSHCRELVKNPLRYHRTCQLKSGRDAALFVSWMAGLTMVMRLYSYLQLV